MKDTLIFTQNRYNLIIVRLTQGKTCCAVQGGYLNKWPNNVILPEGGEIERGREKESKRDTLEHEAAWKGIVKQKCFPNCPNHNTKSPCEYMCSLS